MDGDATEERIATPPSNTAADGAVVRAATEAQRRRLAALRNDAATGDAAFQRVEEELDWTELGWAQVVRPGQPARGEP